MSMHWAPPPLPESIEEIAEVIGRDKAFMLIGQLSQAGKRSWRVCLYVPKKLPLDHPLVYLLGYHDAKKLAWAFAGMNLQPSNGKGIYRAYRNREIRRMSYEGVEVADIAEAVDLSTYRVREILNNEGP